MTAQVYAVKFPERGAGTHHIEQVKVLERLTAEAFTFTVPELIAQMRRGVSVDCISNGGVRSVVEIVEADPPYIRSKADGSLKDNLLSMPRF